MSWNTKPYRTFDAALELKAAGVAVTADGAVGSILDLGGDGLDGGVGAGAAEMRADLVLDVEAIDLANSDESYRLTLQASDTPDFSGDVEELVGITLGKAAVVPQSNVDSRIGRYVVPFYNHRAGAWYRYIRLHVDVSGTSPSIDFGAYLAKRAG